ncbi:beta-galactosidase [Frateuria aurantia]
MADDRISRRSTRRWLSWLLAGLVMVAAALLLVPRVSRQQELTPLQLSPQRAVVWSDFLGVNAHLLWFDPQVQAQQLAMLKRLGLHWLRLDLHWDRIEPEQGQFRWDLLDPVMQQLRDQQLQAEVYLVGSSPYASSAPAGFPYPDKYPPRDPQLYATALRTLAARYPQIPVWQVWNEPNLPGFWYPAPDPQGYARLLYASTQALRSLPRPPQVALGGMAYYSQMPNHQLMISELAALGLFSLNTVIAYHPYSLYPEGDDPGQRDFIVRAQQAQKALRAAGAHQIWADEWGWSSYPGPVQEQPVIGAQGQADFVLRRLALMTTLDYDRIFLFALSDLDSRADLRDQFYGLLTTDAQPKPAYVALSHFLDYVGPRLLPASPPTLQQSPGSLIAVSGARSDGSHLWMFWAAQTGAVRLKGIAAADLYDPLHDTHTSLHASNGILTVPVTSQLQILGWP